MMTIRARRQKTITFLSPRLARYGYAAFASLLLIVVFAINVILDPSLVTGSGALAAWSTLVPLLLLSVAVTPSLLSGHGGIDLSLGPFAGLCTVLIGRYFNVGLLGQPYVVIPTIVILGLVLGLVNGLLVTVVRVQPIIATLGTYLIITGIANHYSPSSGGTVPAWVTGLSGSFVGVLIGLAIVVLWLFMKRTHFYMWLLAVGFDDRTAYASGIPVAKVRASAYVIGGLVAGVAGLLLTALISGGSSSIGPSYTLTSIAAAALGGTSLAGGRGGLLGSCVGALDIFFIENLLTLTNVSVFALNLAYGGILVLAVVANSVIARQLFSSKFREDKTSQGSVGHTLVGTR